MRSSKWSIEDIPSLMGKIIIVTGGNSGLGFQAVKAFASKNARVIKACFNSELTLILCIYFCAKFDKQ